MPQTVGPDLGSDARFAHEGIVRRNAVPPTPVAREGIDADDRTVRHAEGLAEVAWIVGRPGIPEAGIEEPVVRRSRGGRGIERDGADVVVGGELADPEDLPRGAAEHVGPRIVGRPLPDHALVGLGVVVQVIRAAAVRPGAVCRVELAEPRRAGGGELRVERDSHQTGLVGEHRVVEADVAGANVQVRDRRHPVLVGDVEQPAQVVEDEAPRAVPHRRQVLDAGVGQVRYGVEGRLLGLRSANELGRCHDHVALPDRVGHGVGHGLHLRLGREGRGEDDHGGCPERECDVHMGELRRQCRGGCGVGDGRHGLRRTRPSYRPPRRRGKRRVDGACELLRRLVGGHHVELVQRGAGASASRSSPWPRSRETTSAAGCTRPASICRLPSASIVRRATLSCIWS